MCARGILIGAMLLGLASICVPAHATPQGDYLAIYLAQLPIFPSPAPQPIPPPARMPTTNYPWKTRIITTVFWIGEGSTASGWDQHWLRDNGGSDDPDDQDSYASKNHASRLNPFYVALPFNDLVYPDLARRWVPASWFKRSRAGKMVSACQNRWVEIKYDGSGRTCFAQWEDVGPVRTDHAAYVFGPERPDTGNHAGMSISPAVAKYLGIDPHGGANVSWRFVDDADVQPGIWLKYDEQAIIFSAIHQETVPKERAP